MCNVYVEALYHKMSVHKTHDKNAAVCDLNRWQCQSRHYHEHYGDLLSARCIMCFVFGMITKTVFFLWGNMWMKYVYIFTVYVY